MEGRGRHFFKIILPCVLEDHKLQIPPLFMKKYGHHLSNCDSVYLQIAKGSIWEVELMRYKGDVWLRKGWQRFAKYYNIAYGHFLVFKYEGNFKFQVIIFDHSATEIEYQVNGKTISHRDHHIEQNDEMDCRAPEMDGAPNNDDHEEEKVGDDNDDDVSMEILGDLPRRTVKTKEKVEEKYLRSVTTRAKKRSNIDPYRLGRSMQSKRSHRAGKETRSSYFPREESRMCTNDVKLRALRRAEALECNGPSFMIQMTASNVSVRFCVHIPVAHFREHLAGKHDSVVLTGTGPGTKTWFVKCYIRPNRAEIGTGWKRFALDNHLVIGDVCVFELIMANSYKVHIFRAREERNRFYNKHQEDVMDRVLEITKGFKSENPNFRVMMQPSYIEAGYMAVPHHFRKYFTGAKKKITLVNGTEGKSWLVYYYQSESYGRFGNGWKNFVRDNHILEGDVCVFEMMNSICNSYRVTIFNKELGRGFKP